MRRVHRRAAKVATTALIAAGTLAIGAAALAPPAAAGTPPAPRRAAAPPTIRDCGTYARMHLLVTGSRTAARAAGRACRRALRRWQLAQPLPDSAIPPTLRRIRGCESLGDPNAAPDYTAQNQTTTASGAYQYLDTTWGRHLGYTKARLAPPGVQDRRALRDFNAGAADQLWASSKGCWG